MDTYVLTDEERLRIRFIRENLKRIIIMSAIFFLSAPIIIGILMIFANDDSVVKVYRGFLIGSESICILFFLLGTFLRKKKDYTLVPLVYRAFWGFILLFTFGFSFIGMLSEQNVGMYCILISIIALVPLFDVKEYLFSLALQLIYICIAYITLKLAFINVFCMVLLTGALGILSRLLYEQKKKMFLIHQKLMSLAKNAEEDPLTGLLNRRGLDRNLNILLPYSIRNQTTVALIIIDIDNFKRYNDTFGHPQGDKCLKMVASAIKRTARRSTDISARIGGEEFVVFINGTKDLEPVQLAEKLRFTVESLKIKHSPSLGVGAVVTISVGVAMTIPQNMECMTELYNKADKSLYVAKRNGRNIVVFNEKAYAKKKKVVE